MSDHIYVDTNIFLDWWFDRADNLRPLGDFAFRLFQQAVSCRFDVLVSDYTVFALLKEADKLFLVSASPGQKSEADKFAGLHGLPRTDVLHAVIARDNDAVLVTRDRHFEEIGICRTAKPEDLP
jgi:hypothetical protein